MKDGQCIGFDLRFGDTEEVPDADVAEMVRRLQEAVYVLWEEGLVPSGWELQAVFRPG